MAEQQKLRSNHYVRIVTLTTGERVLCIFGEVRDDQENNKVVGYRVLYPFVLQLGEVNEDGTITEGCSRKEADEEAIYELHSCCDKGIVAYDDSVLAERNADDENAPSTKLTPKTGIYNLDDNFAENDLQVVSIEELDGEYELIDVEMENTEIIFINGFYFMA